MYKGESFLHKTSSTAENARLDNKANGLWGPGLAVMSST